jgi:hypothetical protein
MASPRWLRAMLSKFGFPLEDFNASSQLAIAFLNAPSPRYARLNPRFAMNVAVDRFAPVKGAAVFQSVLIGSNGILVLFSAKCRFCLRDIFPVFVDLSGDGRL